MIPHEAPSRRSTSWEDFSLALTDLEKALISAVIAIVGIFVVLFQLRYIRSKRREVVTSADRKDQAFNAILTIRSVASVLSRKGINVGPVEEQLESARRAMYAGDYQRCMSICDSAREELMRSKSAHDARPVEVRRAPKEPDRRLLPEEEPFPAPVSTGRTDEYAGTKLEGKERPPNYLESKFELSAVADEIATARSEGASTGEAEAVLAKGKAAFDAGEYTSALSWALKARRALSPQAEEAPPAGPPEAAAAPAVVKIPARRGAPPPPICAKCGAKLQPGDAFCGRCGTKVQARLVCRQCATELREEDQFCRRCGTPVSEPADEEPAEP